MRNPEIRTMRGTLEFRAAPNPNAIGTLYGYAATFNNLSRDLGGFVEQIAPGAFNKTLADGARVMCRYNHEDEALLGTTDAGTLRLSVDATGLMYEVDLPDTEMGRTCWVLATRGDLRYSSFAFMVPPQGDSWGFTDGEYPMRTLLNVKLVDVAPVNDPAYLDTSSGLRSLAEARGLDFDAVQSAAANRDLRALLKADMGMDGPPEQQPETDLTEDPSDLAPVEEMPEAEEPEPPTDDAEKRQPLDDLRRRLELLRTAR